MNEVLPNPLLQQHSCKIWREGKEADFANIIWLALKLSFTLHFCNNFCPSFILVTLTDFKAFKAYTQNISKWGIKTACKTTENHTCICISRNCRSTRRRESWFGFLIILVSFFLELLWWLKCPHLHLEGKLFLCTFHTLQRLLFQASSPEHRLPTTLSWHIPPCLWVKLDMDFLLQSVAAVSGMECCLIINLLGCTTLVQQARLGHDICQ